MKNVKGRVKVSAVALDDVIPNWFNRVDSSILNMEEGAYCVLGQAFDGDFPRGLRLMRQFNKTGADLSGFYNESRQKALSALEERLLRSAWTYEINVRRREHLKKQQALRRARMLTDA